MCSRDIAHAYLHERFTIGARPEASAPAFTVDFILQRSQTSEQRNNVPRGWKIFTSDLACGM